MTTSITAGQTDGSHKGTRNVTLFRLVVFFLLLSFAFIFLGLLMWRMGWILVLGPIVLPYFPFTLAVLSALACLTLTITSYVNEKRSARSAVHARENNVALKRKNGARGCVGFLIGFVATVIVFNGLLVLCYVSDERISLSSFDITQDRTVRVAPQLGWSAHSKTSIYDLAPFSIIACYSYTTTS